MQYLDSSAIVKLVAREPETPQLVEVVRADPSVASSALAQTEVLRAVKRSGGRRARAEAVLEGIALVPLDDAILLDAATIEPAEVRTLDAIHLATALSLGRDLDRFLTYDRRLADAALAAGLNVGAPGAADEI